MKKLFMMAVVALAFVACAGEKNEEKKAADAVKDAVEDVKATAETAVEEVTAEQGIEE